MLTAGIIIMVASVVLGTVTLILAALLSSPARSAGRRARTRLPGSKGTNLSYQDLFGTPDRGAPGHQVAAEPPAWVRALAILAGAGLLLGLLLVMIPSVT